MMRCLRYFALFLIFAGLWVGMLRSAHAVTLHGTAVEGYEISNTAVSVPITIASGNRLALIVGFSVVHFGGTATHSGCTHNGDAMTLIDSPIGSVAVSGLTGLYVLANPDVGTFNIVCTASTSANEVMLVGAAFSDVNQAGPTTGYDEEAGNASSVTLTPTVTGSNVGVDFVMFYTGGNHSPSQSDTLVHERDATGSNSGYSMQSGDGSLTTTFPAAADFSGAAVALVHDGGGDPDPPTIASVTPSTFEDADTGIVIAGANFGATGNAVLICPTDDVADMDCEPQTITAEDADEITFTAVIGANTEDMTAYLFVVNDVMDSNADGFEVEFESAPASSAIAVLEYYRKLLN